MDMQNSNTPKVLSRPLNDRKLGGVCSGIARWMNLDPTLVRLVYIAGSIVSVAFPGAIAYVLMWVLMPSDSPPEHQN